MIGEGGELIAGRVRSTHRSVIEAFTKVIESLEYRTVTGLSKVALKL